MTWLFVIAWLAVSAWQDIQRREVSNRLTLSALLLAGLYRLWAGGETAWLLAFSILFLVALGFLAGGDGKGLAALALLSPSLLFAAILGGMILLLLYSLLRNEPRAPGYVGFLCGVLLWGCR